MIYPQPTGARNPGSLSLSILLCFTLLVTTSACEAEQDSAEAAPSSAVAEVTPNTLTEAEAEEGWVLLFNGESFDGWRGYRKDEVPTEHWKIEDGSIHDCDIRMTGNAIMGSLNWIPKWYHGDAAMAEQVRAQFPRILGSGLSPHS